MKRLITKDILKWKESKDRKPLILKGVRQCGKTYLLKKIGEDYYDDVAYFNFEGNTLLQDVFKNDFNVERILTELSILRNKTIGKDTLIIFDEIQFCNNAISSLKYFYENATEYHVVSAGSLLGVALSKPLSFPVGKVDILTMKPMNFYEFLLANGEEMLCDYLDKFSINDKLSEAFSKKLEGYLRDYYIVGGMPEVVKSWVENRNIEDVEKYQQNILESYELDFAKHAPTKDFPKLSLIWRSIPAQLAKESGKFIFGQVKKGLRAKDLEDALEWLISAGLVYKVRKISKPFMPLSTYADESYFKLYLADVGLLRKLAKLPAKTLFETADGFKEFKGALAENYVLCEILAQQNDVPYYWKSENIAEVDFVVQLQEKIVPIEVKSGDSGRSKSLAMYRKKYSPELSIKLSLANIYSASEGVINLPLYMAWKAGGYK